MVGRRGATLLELLVVLTLFSAILTAILGFYIYAQKATNMYQRTTAQFEEVERVRNKLEGILKPAVRLQLLDPVDVDGEQWFRGALFSRIDLAQPLDPTQHLIFEEAPAYRLYTEMAAEAMANPEAIGGGRLVLVEKDQPRYIGDLPLGTTVRYRVAAPGILTIRHKRPMEQQADPSSAPLPGVPGLPIEKKFYSYVFLDNCWSTGAPPEARSADAARTSSGSDR